MSKYKLPTLFMVMRNYTVLWLLIIYKLKKRQQVFSQNVNTKAFNFLCVYVLSKKLFITISKR